jgi:hypothetical protein
MSISEIKNLWYFVNDELDVDADKNHIAALLNDMDSSFDFYWEVNGEEYRVIHEMDIDTVLVEELKDLVEECYLSDSDLAKLWWLEIDWEQTAENVVNADGYGHHFSRYDGNEYDHNDWYFFRCN